MGGTESFRTRSSGTRWQGAPRVARQPRRPRPPRPSPAVLSGRQWLRPLEKEAALQPWESSLPGGASRCPGPAPGTAPGPRPAHCDPEPPALAETHLSVAQPGRPNRGSSRAGSSPRGCHSEAGAGRGAAQEEGRGRRSACSLIGWAFPAPAYRRARALRPVHFPSKKALRLLRMDELTNIKRKAKVILVNDQPFTCKHTKSSQGIFLENFQKVCLRVKRLGGVVMGNSYFNF